MSSHFKLVEQLLHKADVRINGSKPWDITVSDPRFYKRVIEEGSLGLGEAYMDEWWESESLSDFFYHVLRAGLEKCVRPNLRMMLSYLWGRCFNQQTIRKSRIVGQVHYDIGNDLYRAMLDPYMAYSCGYWPEEGMTLASAQEAKLDLICRKIGLQFGQSVLDIGGGWGSFARYAAKYYRAKVDIYTISREQAELGIKLSAGLDVNFHLEDYRKIRGEYDHVVSVGMVEHVGYKNYRKFMEIASRAVKNNGFFLLHTIGRNSSTTGTDPWISRYIFPNSMIPSIQQLSEAAEGLFVVEDLHNFGADYDKTLMAWFSRFHAAWPTLEERYGERFYRMWKYYLLSCAGSFRARKNQLWQIVLSPQGKVGGYKTHR